MNANPPGGRVNRRRAHIVDLQVPAFTTRAFRPHAQLDRRNFVYDVSRPGFYPTHSLGAVGRSTGSVGAFGVNAGRPRMELMHAVFFVELRVLQNAAGRHAVAQQQCGAGELPEQHPGPADDRQRPGVLWGEAKRLRRQDGDRLRSGPGCCIGTNLKSTMIRRLAVSRMNDVTSDGG